ncbi:MAG: metal-dependent hydrolase [Gammaproteobacteria bacterium]|jgi:predicted metal-dependent hydrolase|nr:metal-dependent hydrolase [Gammaproteobacteria bacterium]
MHQITVNDIVVDVVRKNIKNLHLAVYPPVGRVRIAVPSRTSDDAIRLFVISKLPWIKKHRTKLQTQERQPAREYVTGESHYYQGNRFLLNVIHENSKNKVIVRDKTFIDLIINKESTLEHRHRVMTEWYRKQLKEQISPMIDKWQKIIGVNAASHHIRQMRTRWGSCNVRTKRILFNLELIKKPTHCMEYVVVHELVHLLERLHNHRFISYMDKFMPQWRSYREELNRFIRDSR